MNEKAIDVKDLSKKFGTKVAVDKISLEVARGEIFGFLGPNGSGKTTTIRMLCGLMQPDSGEGTCLGFDIIKQPSAIKPLVGYVPQAFSLYKDLTVYENLLFVAKANNQAQYKSIIAKTLDDLHLIPFKNILAGSLSGGWKQRLSLAAALLHHPQLLLLDEPTAGVDPKTRREFWNYIAQLTNQGITVLLSTHYMDEAERCNRLAYIVNGKLMIQGRINQIMEHVKLHTWAAEGQELRHLADQLESYPEIEQITPWGNTLRVCGTNASAISQIIEGFPKFQWNKVSTSLEEVFVHLVNERVAQSEELS
jgi:ABC-2 type transport system ATP-binding protein